MEVACSEAMALTSADVSSRFPIHWLVWHNRHTELKDALAANKYTTEDIERLDPRGRTPLLLAVTLGYLQCVRALAEAGADVNCEKDGWTAVHEATVVGDTEMLTYVLSRRDHQRFAKRGAGIPDLLKRLSLAPDFYVEMKWEFTSWLPLVSRMCPFDTYKVYKRGANVRVDTTLVGFEDSRWTRGDRTYIFRGNGNKATLVELDHETQSSWLESYGPVEVGRSATPSRRAVEARLSAPLNINYLDTERIAFERSKTGLWGWRQDRTEEVSGYNCKVFSATNVEIVSKTRSEHLPDSGRKQASKAPFAGLLALADSDRLPVGKPQDTEDSSEQSTPLTPLTPTRPDRSREELVPNISWEEYFSDTPLDRDIGKTKDICTRVQKFKATLWLCEDYPLELQEQIMPILDLMSSISSPHFSKLKDFIQMQLPAGFPVKVEIPLFHVMNARVTFCNIFAQTTPVPNIETIQEGDRLSCIVDDVCFQIGSGYRDIATGWREDWLGEDEEENLMQYAIQHSLMEPGSHHDQVDVWEALRGTRPTTPTPAPPRSHSPHLTSHEERALQRAIEESLATVSLSQLADNPVEDDPELAEVLALSAREEQAFKDQLASEQQALDEALRLSLLDK